jgi:hypothetical protein
MGRRAHTPDPAGRRQVEAMAAYGVPEADIATVIGIDPKTLRRHYRQELDTGHIKANSKVAENLFRKATGDGREAVIAAIFWLKTRAHWKETVVQEAEVRHSYVIRAPPPVAGVAEWLERYAPPEIEHEARPVQGISEKV